MATLTASGVNFSDGSTINGTVRNTIGSFILAGAPFGATGVFNNNSVAGSNLRLSTVLSNATPGTPNPSLSGTYRNCGYYSVNTDPCSGGLYCSTTLWVRVS